MNPPKRDNAGRQPGEVVNVESNQQHDSNPPDPVLGWFSLAKPLIARHQKQRSRFRKQQGQIDAFLLAHLSLLLVVVLLVIGGLNHV